jgi:hypothetical protein
VAGRVGRACFPRLRHDMYTISILLAIQSVLRTDIVISTKFDKNDFENLMPTRPAVLNQPIMGESEKGFQIQNFSSQSNCDR